MELLTTVLVVFGTLAGMPVVIAAALVGAMWHPGLAAGVLGATLVMRRPPKRESPGSDEAVFLAALAAELRGGATVRQAIVDAAARVPRLPLTQSARLAASGADVAAVAGAVSAALPGSGSVAAPAVQLAVEHGGHAAGMFERLALRAAQRVELEAEVHVATAQARLSVKVLVALPLLLVAVLAMSGQLGAVLAAGTAGRFLVGLGLGLQTTGVVAVAWLLRRAGL